MNTCGTCKYFGKNAKDEDLLDSDYWPSDQHKFCTRITHGDTCTTDIATVVDASGYFAALCVKEDFGCNQWEPS